MKSKFLVYAIVVALMSSVVSWTSMARRATGGFGTGNSWHSWSSGGYGGGFAGSSGGGHK